MPERTRRRSAVGRYALLVLLAVVVLTPVYVTVVGAFKPGNKFLDFPQSLYPSGFTLATLREAWTNSRMGHFLVNSAVVAVLITVGQLFTSVLAGYAFACLRFPARRAIFFLFLATLMVPAEATLLSNVKTVQTLHWTDSYTGLVVPFLATAFGTFLLRQVFMQVPKDLRDAAELDGVGHIGFMWNVAVPLARPTLGALGLFSFLGAWNQYLWPLRITNRDDRRTVQIGLRLLAATGVDKLNLIMAGTVIASVPILVVLIVFQRQLIRGLTAGAVKG